jgi:diaminopimelate epimerase
MNGPNSEIKSDGLLVAERSQIASLRMRVFNPDGSEAEMSGNGLRLFCKFVVERGLVDPRADCLDIETTSGIRTAWPKVTGGVVVAVRVSLGIPQFEPERIPVDTSNVPFGSRPQEYRLEVLGRGLTLTCLSLGNPHAVAFPNEPIGAFPITIIGPLVEHHPMFPNRTNFEIVEVISRSCLRARIWERGVGETRSSGTGSTAAVVAARVRGLVDDRVVVRLPGGELTVSWDGRSAATLQGPVENVLSGAWDVQTLAVTRTA